MNRSPSFGTDTKLDSEIKGGVLTDALNLLNIRCSISEERYSISRCVWLNVIIISIALDLKSDYSEEILSDSVDSKSILENLVRNNS